MTATKTPSKATVSTRAAATPRDAIALLKADHEAVSGLFADYEKASSAATKAALVAEICTALSIHMQIEEEIFYPEIKRALKDKLLVPEATVEHSSVAALIAQLEDEAPDGEMYDARVKVLSEYVKHHVKEEHSGMFPQAKASSLDMVELGDRMAARKADLMAEWA